MARPMLSYGPGSRVIRGNGDSMASGFAAGQTGNMAYSTGYGAGAGSVMATSGGSMAMRAGGMGPGVGYGMGPGGMGPGGGRMIVGPGPNPDGCCAPGCAGGPESEANCGGVGGMCCEASGAMVTGTKFCYVGNGGDYAPATSYNYVGQGCGTYTKEVILQPYGCKLRFCCIVVSLLLLLLPLLYWLMTRGESPELAPLPSPVPIVPNPGGTPTQLPVLPPPPLGPIGKCLIWGDPHALSFDSKRNDFYSSGEFWVVKSKDVWIQARYLPTRATNGLAVCKEIAIGGPVIHMQKLIIGPQEATFNGRPILTTFGSSFRALEGAVDMEYNGQGTVLQEGREGKALHVVHIKIQDGSPEGLLIQVNRWNEPGEGCYINVKIIMHARPEARGGQDGHCGNFNGNPADDDRLLIRQRLGKTGVPEEELLFDKKTPIVVANRPSINDCPQDKLDQCKTICKEREKKFIPSKHCLVDCCFAGAGFLQEG